LWACSSPLSTFFQLALKLQRELAHARELSLVWLFPELTLHGLHQALDAAA